MKGNSADEQGSNPRKRASNFKTDEVNFFLFTVVFRELL